MSLLTVVRRSYLGTQGCHWQTCNRSMMQESMLSLTGIAVCKLLVRNGAAAHSTLPTDRTWKMTILGLIAWRCKVTAPWPEYPLGGRKTDRLRNYSDQRAQGFLKDRASCLQLTCSWCSWTISMYHHLGAANPHPRWSSRWCAGLQDCPGWQTRRWDLEAPQSPMSAMMRMNEWLSMVYG